MSKSEGVAADGLKAAKLLREVAGKFGWLQSVHADNEKSGPCGLSNGSPGFRCGFVKNHDGACMDAFAVLEAERDKMLGLLSTVPTLLEQAAHAIDLVCQLNAEVTSSDPRNAVLLKFIASLTLADHLGDVCNDIDEVLTRTGLLEGETWDTLEDLSSLLAKRGVTTLVGTSLGDG
jgi:hypothetical protein